MYSLTIYFGPNAVCWSFLFKEEAAATEARMRASTRPEGATHFSIADDFGSTGIFAYESVHGYLLEDLEAVETARIQRSLAEERCKVKLMNAARTDPVIGPAMRGGGAQVLAPNFRQ